MLALDGMLNSLLCLLCLSSNQAGTMEIYLPAVPVGVGFLSILYSLSFLSLSILQPCQVILPWICVVCFPLKREKY